MSRHSEMKRQRKERQCALRLHAPQAAPARGRRRLASAAAAATRGATLRSKRRKPGAALDGTIEADGSCTVGPLDDRGRRAVPGGELRRRRDRGHLRHRRRLRALLRRRDRHLRRLAPDQGRGGVRSAPRRASSTSRSRSLTTRLTIVVNTAERLGRPCLTVEQLKAIWAPEAEGTVTTWNQVDPASRTSRSSLFGPGTDSGTFDYFRGGQRRGGREPRRQHGLARTTTSSSRRVAGEKGGLGFFGFTYYYENKDKLKAVPIDGGSRLRRPDAPRPIADGDYAPLAGRSSST